MLLDTCEIVCRTDLIDTAKWLELRLDGIGASEASVAMGESRYQKRSQLLTVKRGRIIDQRDTPAMRLGRAFERPVAQLFATDEARAVFRWPVMLRSLAYPFILCTPDFFVCDAPDFAGEVIDWLEDEPPPNILSAIEVKTSGFASRVDIRPWKNGGVPLAYDRQALHQQIVMGLSITVVAMLAGHGLHIRPRVFDDDDAAFLISEERAFWDEVAG